MKIFVINMEGATDRWSHYKDKEYKRWLGTHHKELRDDDPRFKKMISYHNINPIEHKSKVGCMVSHLNIWKYIVMNKLEDILILEDDADRVRDIPSSGQLPDDGITYFGGITWSPKITDGQKKINFNTGINKINFDEYRVLQTMSYFIPRWEIAKEMIESIESRPRYRCPRAPCRSRNAARTLPFSCTAPCTRRRYPAPTWSARSWWVPGGRWRPSSRTGGPVRSLRAS